MEPPDDPRPGLLRRADPHRHPVHRVTTFADPDVTESTTTDPARHAHYARKTGITDAYVFGSPLEALCGYVFVPSQNPERLPVCPRCRELFEARPK